MVAGSVALASAAFAVGSQTGDGTADARGEGRAERGGAVLFGPGPPGHGRFRGGPPGFESLADRLGVSESRLRRALRDVRPGGDPRDELVKSLAESLDVEEQAVRDAFDRFHQQKHDEFAQRLADRLGIDVDKVKEALPPRP